MTFENDALQAIAETLVGIQTELKTLNQQMAQSAKAKTTKPDAPASSSSFKGADFRPKRAFGPKSGPPKSDRGPSPYSDTRSPKPFKGNSDKPPARKPR